ncbi:HAMP domain-containing sensor histidine kinase [Methylorubrum thiocyanatum]|uniref:HAMP domain-containing sensor histidine kinase n=1 Tax=Methylorubrum thiocyanatum TaxID=47958 RepID=UPI00383A6DEB
MAKAGAGMASPASDRRELNLKWALVRRIVTVGLLCVVGTTVVIMNNVAVEARQQNDEIARTVEKQLQLQLFRIDTALDRADRFPDWQAVTSHSLSSGQCVSLIQVDPPRTNSNCVGVDERGTAPSWFVHAYRLLFLSQSNVERALLHRGVERGRIVVTTDPGVVTRQAWGELSRLLGLLAALVAVLCLLVFVVVSHALRPTRQILAGINRLANGDLSSRLPPFHLSELQRISEVFNEMAERLQTTTQERAELARKLVDAQERERSHIARELHDDVAQRLTALTFLARSIKDGVGTAAPEVSAESAELVAMAAGTMRSLRDTLGHLRPPEIDDLGLAVSLQELVAEQNRRSSGQIAFALRTDGDLDALPAETAAHIYRIVQEGLNNAVRHAEARSVEVVLAAGPTGEVLLTVTDDGRGATPEDLRRPGTGFGLIGMRERVYALSGRMTTEAGPMNGLRLRISFPSELEMRAVP